MHINERVPFDRAPDHDNFDIGTSIVGGLMKKKWGIYLSPEKIQSIDNLSSIISMGRTTLINSGRRYVLLPSIEDDADPKKVINAIQKLRHPPCYVDAFHNDGKFVARGVYPIDSFMLNGDFILMLDRQMFHYFGVTSVPPSLTNPCMCLSYENISEVIHNINPARFKDEDNSLKYLAPGSDSVN